MQENLYSSTQSLQAKPTLVLTMTSKSSTVELFVSYAAKDDELRKEFSKHLSSLKGNGTIRDWSEDDITGGSVREDEIRRNISQAQIILLLISSDFLDSKFCKGSELKEAMLRHEQGKASVIPIILRPVYLQGTPFSNLQMLPKNQKPVTRWEDRDEAFTEVVIGLREIIEKISEVQIESRFSPENDSFTSISSKDNHISDSVNSVSETEASKLKTANYKPLEYELNCKIPSNKHGFLLILLICLITTLPIIGLRFFALLQPYELSFFDHLMTLRAKDAPSDKRLLVVTITQEDIDRLNPQLSAPFNKRPSLPDDVMAQMLKKLEEHYSPKVIGLDLYHDFPANPSLKTFLTENNRLIREQRLFNVCKFPPNGVAPPPEAPPAGQGFSDFAVDGNREEVVRRYLLQVKQIDSANSLCKATYSLSLQIALRYLQDLNISAKVDREGYLTSIGNITIKPLEYYTGGYQYINDLDQTIQILLDYHSPSFLNTNSPQNIAHQVTLTQLLNDQVENVEDLKNRIVLVGRIDSEDEWNTPVYSDKIAGVFIHAQMVSQILRVVEDKEPTLWVWSQGKEILWIFGWSIFGGFIAWGCCQFSYWRICWLFTQLIAVSVLYGICVFTFLSLSGWIPFVPALLVFIISNLGVLTFSRFNFNRAALSSEKQ
jgi:CHASE2 domain-containing sensor protein